MPDNIVQPQIPTTPVTPAILEKLRAIVGDKGLVSGEQDMQPFVTDWRRTRSGNAAVVVRPGTVEEVSKVVKLCHDNGIAIVPQAGNTGLMGGATPWPTHRGIVLSVGFLLLGWWLMAAYRPERSAEIVQLLNDISWSQFLGVISPFYFVPLSIAYRCVRRCTRSSRPSARPSCPTTSGCSRPAVFGVTRLAQLLVHWLVTRLDNGHRPALEPLPEKHTVA